MEGHMHGLAGTGERGDRMCSHEGGEGRGVKVTLRFGLSTGRRQLPFTAMVQASGQAGVGTDAWHDPCEMPMGSPGRV